MNENDSIDSLSLPNFDRFDTPIPRRISIQSTFTFTSTQNLAISTPTQAETGEKKDDKDLGEAVIENWTVEIPTSSLREICKSSPLSSFPFVSTFVDDPPTSAERSKIYTILSELYHGDRVHSNEWSRATLKSALFLLSNDAASRDSHVFLGICRTLIDTINMSLTC